MLADALTLVLDAPNRPDWARVGQHLPYEWIEQAVIEQAVTETGKASIRHRRLPAAQVVCLIVALALYRHKSISEVIDELDLALPDAKASFVSKSAMAQARQRLGEAPLNWLFHTSARPWSGHDRNACLFKGLSLLAMGGMTFRTANSPVNREHFGTFDAVTGGGDVHPIALAVVRRNRIVC